MVLGQHAATRAEEESTMTAGGAFLLGEIMGMVAMGLGFGLGRRHARPATAAVVLGAWAVACGLACYCL